MSSAPSARACTRSFAAIKHSPMLGVGLGLIALVLCVSATGLAQDGPSRDDVGDFLSSLRADLFTCGRGWHGSLELEIVFTSDGAVRSVGVEGDGAPDHVLGCVGSVVRGGHVRPFTAPTATVEHSIRL
jgi:hypothetical protein